VGRTLAALLLALAATACAGIPKDALTLAPQSLEWRQMQTRQFETPDEGKIRAACAALLMDVGFIVEESETPLGVIVATKRASAVDTGQVIGAVALTILGAMAGSHNDVPWDDEQLFRCSVVTHPAGATGQSIAVRVTFQRLVWNNQRQLSKIERIDDPAQYVEFFDKLSKSVFLEAQEVTLQ
jgi:hypothetical protein